jgi:uncharacterized lipoprotein YbaY
MFRLFLFAIVALFYGIQGAAIEKEITGKVTCVDTKIINAKWKVCIELRDTIEKNEVGRLVASTCLSDAKTFPISYTLKYNVSDIKSDHKYLLVAKINGSHDQLLFTNSTPALLTETKSPVIDIVVVRVGTNGKPCLPVQCPSEKPKTCAYGYQKKDGCEICKCHDPCKNHSCEKKERCVVDKKDDGTFLAKCDKALIKRENKEKLHTKEACDEPKKIGSCRKSESRFYYNSLKKACEEFTYGGCDGNANNFKTKLECEKLCKV